jgi:hypothetical protein
MEKRSVERDTRIVWSRKPIDVEVYQTDVESDYSISHLVTPGLALTDSERSEAITDIQEILFQSVTDHSFPARIEAFEVALRSYFLTPARELNSSHPYEVHEAFPGLKSARFRDKMVS